MWIFFQNYNLAFRRLETIVSWLAFFYCKAALEMYMKFMLSFSPNGFVQNGSEFIFDKQIHAECIFLQKI